MKLKQEGEWHRVVAREVLEGVLDLLEVTVLPACSNQRVVSSLGNALHILHFEKGQINDSDNHAL